MPDTEPGPEPTQKRPRVTDSFHPDYLKKSALSTAWQAQKKQRFGKDNLAQVYTTEPVFFHVLFPLLKLGFLAFREMRRLFVAVPPASKLWHEYQRVKDLDWSPLCSWNMNWQDQTEIDDHRVDMRLSMLFHFNLDLAAVHRAIGGNHVGSHRDPDVILPRLSGLLDDRMLSEIRRIYTDGCPCRFNDSGTAKEFAEALEYGNHPSLNDHLDKVMKTMNKEDRKDQVLTFPEWVAMFIQHLMTTAQGYVMLPGKNDRLVFDASYMLHSESRPFNHRVDLIHEPEILYGGSWLEYLKYLYNLRITYPDKEIVVFDDDVTGAFRQPKYHPNVISAKAYIIGKYLFVPTGLTFGDKPSPPSFEPLARARMALSREYSKGLHDIPEFSEYLDRVRFVPPPPPGFQFAQARPDRFNQGIVIPTDGSHPPTEYNMYVDDNLYAAASHDDMRWAMRCSIAGLIGVLGDNEPDLRPSQPDTEKFFKTPVSYMRRQLGYITNTRTMTISIPDDKRQELLDTLTTKWGPASGRSYFTLTEAAELLGVLVSMCRVCPWGIFLFQNLYHAMYATLANNAAAFGKQKNFVRMWLCAICIVAIRLILQNFGSSAARLLEPFTISDPGLTFPRLSGRNWSSLPTSFPTRLFTNGSRPLRTLFAANRIMTLTRTLAFEGREDFPLPSFSGGLLCGRTKYIAVPVYSATTNIEFRSICSSTPPSSLVLLALSLLGKCCLLMHARLLR
jgi:hypothetical protein